MSFAASCKSVTTRVVLQESGTNFLQQITKAIAKTDKVTGICRTRK